MKVLKLSRFSPVPYSAPTGFGGAAIESPMAILQSMGHEIDVVAPVPYAPFILKHFKSYWRSYSQVPDYETTNGIRVMHPRYLSIPGIFSIAGWLMMNGCVETIRELRSNVAYDVVHAHFGYPDGVVGMRVAAKTQIPLVVTLQATDIDITAKMNKTCFAALKEVLYAASVVIAPTEIIAKKTKQLFGLEPSVVHYGIDDRAVVQQYPALEEATATRPPIILSVCQLIPSKGIDIVLHGLGSIIATGKRLSYVIVGHGPDRERLETLSNSLGLQQHVRFAGTMDHERVMKFMSSCDIFVMPSWQETFGLVYVEAMAHSKPVIACYGQGISEIIADCEAGVLVPPHDSSAVAMALAKLLENPAERRRLGNNARHRALTMTHRHTALRTLEIYKLAVSLYNNPKRRRT